MSAPPAPRPPWRLVLADPEAEQLEVELGFEGLLGSDILSEFGTVTVDYEQEMLVLRPHDH